MGEYKDDQMTSTQLDSHANTVVVGQNYTIINQSGNSANVRKLSSDCSKSEAVPIVDAVVAYDCPPHIGNINTFDEKWIVCAFNDK